VYPFGCLNYNYPKVYRVMQYWDVYWYKGCPSKERLRSEIRQIRVTWELAFSNWRKAYTLVINFYIKRCENERSGVNLFWNVLKYHEKQNKENDLYWMLYMIIVLICIFSLKVHFQIKIVWKFFLKNPLLFTS